MATNEGNRQRTRKEQRSQQSRKRKESSSNMLQMWPTRSLGQRLSTSSLKLYNLSDTTYEQQYDNTAQWYYPNKGYDANWFSSDQTGYYQDNGQQYQQPQQTPHLALTTPTPTTAQEQQTPAMHLVAPLNNKMSSTPMASTLQSVQQDENKVDIMIDIGAATHVCPPWFAPNKPMYNWEHGQGPQLRTATDENIPV